MSKFGIVPPQVPVIRSLVVLAPRFRARVEALLRDMAREGYDPMIAETLRTDARQRYLYGFGRDYDDGRGIVTYAATGPMSWHFFGLAVDVISRADGWNARHEFWAALAASAGAHGLTGGGDWPSFSDKAHVQFGSPMSNSPPPQTLATYESGGFHDVWKVVGAV